MRRRVRHRRNRRFGGARYLKSLMREISTRWKSDTPKFFKWIMRIGLSISAIAIAMNTSMEVAHANVPSWWDMIYPYLVSIPAGMAATATLTKVDKDDVNKSSENKTTDN